MLKYSLQDNPLTPDPTDFMATVQDNEKCTIDELIEEITGDGSILKDTECKAVSHALFRALGKQLKAGKGFTSEYLIIDHSISGVFTNEEDNFDPKRHQVNINLRLGSLLREAVQGIKVEKVKSSIPMPVLKACYDHWSQTYNDVITPRGSVDITGEQLKIGDLDDPEQGIFLIDSKQAATRIDRVAQNMPKKLVFSVPDTLKKGDYTLEVRTLMKGTNKLRTGKLNQTLVVA